AEPTRWRRGRAHRQPPTLMDFGFTCVGLDPDGHRIRALAPAWRGFRRKFIRRPSLANRMTPKCWDRRRSSPYDGARGVFSLGTPRDEASPRWTDPGFALYSPPRVSRGAMSRPHDRRHHRPFQGPCRRLYRRHSRQRLQGQYRYVLFVADDGAGRLQSREFPRLPDSADAPRAVHPHILLLVRRLVAALPASRAGELFHFRQSDAGRFRLSRPEPQRGAGIAVARGDSVRHSLLEDAVPARRLLHLHRLRPRRGAAAGDLRAMIEELDGHTLPRRQVSAQDAMAHYRNIIGGFTETIRLSDFKANVAIVFTGIMMGPVVSFRAKLPHYLPLDVALAPFLIV